MATTFETLNYTFYSNGTSGASAIVGYESNVNRVVRYKFTTPSSGATKLTFTKENISVYSNSIGSGENLRFYITDSATSHIKAGASSTYHGTVTVTNGEKATGSVDIVLLPNKDYYLYIFPGFTSYGAYNWNYAIEITVTLDGSVGLAYISNGSTDELYQIYIEDGSSWDIYTPYIDNGSSWEIYT